MKVSDIVKKGRDARFSHYRQGYLYYNILVTQMENEVIKTITYSFPIEIKDLGGATVSNTEKSVTLMRYIRKALADETFVRVSK